MNYENSTSHITAIEYVVGGVLVILVACIGFVGNIASIIYFGRQKYRTKAFFLLLLFLALFDNIYLIGKLLQSKAIEYISSDFSSFASHAETSNDCYILLNGGCLNIFIFWTAELHMFGVTGSIFFTLSICMERYIVICRPFFHQAHSINRKTYVSVVVFLTIALNITFFFLWAFKRNTEYIILMIATLLVIPCLLLTMANVLIVKALIENRKMFYRVANANQAPRSAAMVPDRVDIRIPMSTLSARVDNVDNETNIDRRRKKNVELAIISLIISVVFIISHLLNALSDIFKILPPHFVPVSNLLVVMNSSMNFYLFMTKKFFNNNI